MPLRHGLTACGDGVPQQMGL